MHPNVSMIFQKDMPYPKNKYYSPDTFYPEYMFSDISKTRNPVYGNIRKILLNLGLDSQNANTEKWNPLGEFVKPGDNVFILCNFVYHKKSNESYDDFFAKCTHPSVIRAVVDYVLIALKDSGLITIGNASLQSCIWPKVIKDTHLDNLIEFYHSNNKQFVSSEDLRLYVGQRDFLGKITKEKIQSDEKAVFYDLADKSLLDIFNNKQISKFRVSDYDPNTMKSFHRNGKHIYALNKKIIQSDVIISIPKLKTHVKVGITCGLKGCVGAIGRKECLAHYTQGGKGSNGDEFPESGLFFKNCQNLESKFHDIVNSYSPQGFGNFLRIIDRSLRRLIGKLGLAQAGGWPGNDTTWRMTLDIARIIRFGMIDGKLSKTEQRKHLLFTDGVIGGENMGPLSPTPISSGVLLFSDDIAIGDYVNSLLIGFDPSKIQLIKESFNIKDWPITDNIPENIRVNFNGEIIDACKIAMMTKLKFTPPRHWRGYIELDD